MLIERLYTLDLESHVPCRVQALCRCTGSYVLHFHICSFLGSWSQSCPVDNQQALSSSAYRDWRKPAMLKKKEREQSILELGSERLLTRMFFSSWAGQLTWWRLRYIYAAGPIKEVGWELGGDNWFFSTLKVTHVWFNWKSMSFFLLVQESLAVCRGDPSSIWNLSTKQLNCGGLG